MLRIPAGIIDIRYKPGMDHHLVCPIACRQAAGLPVALGRQSPGLRIDGAGKELIERAMEDPARDPLYLRQNLLVVLFKVLVHIAGGTVLRNLHAQALSPGDAARFRVNGGKIDALFFHNRPRLPHIFVIITISRQKCNRPANSH